jgi:ketosteroid isomerase-like protein
MKEHLGRTLMALALGLGAAPLASARAATAPAGHQSGEESAVLAVMDAWMRSITSGDRQAMAALQTPEGMTYRARHGADGEGIEVTSASSAYWADPAREDGRRRQERYWSPSVFVRGLVAVVWAPYEFQVDGQVSHCGIDVVNFVKKDGRWLVANAMWTVEPGACDELRPADPGAIRPAD